MSNIIENHKGALLLVDSKRKKLLPINNIIMLEGNINYTIFHMKFGKKKLFAHTLLTYEADLNAFGFLRVHRGYIINPAFAQKFQSGDNIIHLAENLQAHVSRRRSANTAVKQLINQF